MIWKYDVVVVGFGIVGFIVVRNVVKVGFFVFFIDKKWVIGILK